MRGRRRRKQRTSSWAGPWKARCLMTDLKNPVKRRTRFPFAHYRKRIVVILEPGDLLAMRLEKTRKLFRAPIAAVYRQLVEWHVAAMRREKKLARKKRRA